MRLLLPSEPWHGVVVDPSVAVARYQPARTVSEVHGHFVPEPCFLAASQASCSYERQTASATQTAQAVGTLVPMRQYSKASLILRS